MFARERTWCSSGDSNMSKTYENYGNKSHQTTANNAQLATIIHLKINRDMFSSISNKIVIFDFHVISNDCEQDGPHSYSVRYLMQASRSPSSISKLSFGLRFLKLSGLQNLESRYSSQTLSTQTSCGALIIRSIFLVLQ